MYFKMNFNLITLLFIFALIIQYVSSECKVESQSYTTSDGIVIARVAHIITFTAHCDNRAKDIALYADLNGKTLPAIRATDTSNGQTYQISWTVDLLKASSGSHSIPIYDEEGAAQVRKAQRAGPDQTQQTPVKPLFTLELYHSSPYKGPVIQTELVATLAALGLWWLAYNAKTKLTN